MVPKRGLLFGVFYKLGGGLKYFEKGSTHTPITLRSIPFGVINYILKLKAITPRANYESIDAVYPEHEQSLCKSELNPHISTTMTYLWK